MNTRKFSQIALAVLASVSIASYAAQGSGRPEMPVGRMHGHGELIVAALTQAKTNLQLSSSQEALWNEAVAASTAARELAKQQRTQLKAVIDAEKAKEVMDLAALVGARETVQETVEKARDGARDKWLAVYQALTLEQKRIASQRIKDMWSRIGKMRGHGG